MSGPAGLALLEELMVAAGLITIPQMTRNNGGTGAYDIANAMANLHVGDANVQMFHDAAELPEAPMGHFNQGPRVLFGQMYSTHCKNRSKPI
jgi:hypothetical protein